MATVISRIALRVTGGKFISFQPDGSIAVRDNPNSPGEPGAFETIEVLLLDGGVPVLPGSMPEPPQPPVPPVTPWDLFAGSAQEWFAALIYGKLFGQQTLLDLEPVLKANNWQLTRANAVGDRTKIQYPGGPWVRVGFGEGSWQWIEQIDK